MKSKRRKAKIQASRSISVPCSEPAQELQIIRPDAGGIDCGAQEHYVAVPPDRVSAASPRYAALALLSLKESASASG